MTVGIVGKFELQPGDVVTSDTHFGHANVIKYCARPYCCKHSMTEDLIWKWNSVVTPEMRVFHLGDFAFGSPSFVQRVLSRLNGYKILIRGNHDRGRHKMVELGFQEVYASAEATYGDQTIMMRHVPDYEANIHLKWDYHLCGHVHEKYCSVGRVINVGVDVWGLTPQRLDHVLANHQKQQLARATQLTDLAQAKEERDDGLIKQMYERYEERDDGQKNP